MNDDQLHLIALELQARRKNMEVRKSKSTHVPTQMNVAFNRFVRATGGFDDSVLHRQSGTDSTKNNHLRQVFSSSEISSTTDRIVSPRRTSGPASVDNIFSTNTGDSTNVGLNTPTKHNLRTAPRGSLSSPLSQDISVKHDEFETSVQVGPSRSDQYHTVSEFGGNRPSSPSMAHHRYSRPEFQLGNSSRNSRHSLFQNTSHVTTSSTRYANISPAKPNQDLQIARSGENLENSAVVAGSGEYEAIFEQSLSYSRSLSPPIINRISDHLGSTLETLNSPQHGRSTIIAPLASTSEESREVANAYYQTDPSTTLGSSRLSGYLSRSIQRHIGNVEVTTAEAARGYREYHPNHYSPARSLPPPQQQRPRPPAKAFMASSGSWEGSIQFSESTSAMEPYCICVSRDSGTSDRNTCCHGPTCGRKCCCPVDRDASEHTMRSSYVLDDGMDTREALNNTITTEVEHDDTCPRSPGSPTRMTEAQYAAVTSLDEQNGPVLVRGNSVRSIQSRGGLQENTATSSAKSLGNSGISAIKEGQKGNVVENSGLGSRSSPSRVQLQTHSSFYLDKSGVYIEPPLSPSPPRKDGLTELEGSEAQSVGENARISCTCGAHPSPKSKTPQRNFSTLQNTASLYSLKGSDTRAPLKSAVSASDGANSSSNSLVSRGQGKTKGSARDALANGISFQDTDMVQEVDDDGYADSETEDLSGNEATTRFKQISHSVRGLNQTYTDSPSRRDVSGNPANLNVSDSERKDRGRALAEQYLSFRESMERRDEERVQDQEKRRNRRNQEALASALEAVEAATGAASIFTGSGGSTTAGMAAAVLSGSPSRQKGAEALARALDREVTDRFGLKVTEDSAHPGDFLVSAQLAVTEEAPGREKQADMAPVNHISYVENGGEVTRESIPPVALLVDNVFAQSSRAPVVRVRRQSLEGAEPPMLHPYSQNNSFEEGEADNRWNYVKNVDFSISSEVVDNSVINISPPPPARNAHRKANKNSETNTFSLNSSVNSSRISTVNNSIDKSTSRSVKSAENLSALELLASEELSINEDLEEPLKGKQTEEEISPIESNVTRSSAILVNEIFDAPDSDSEFESDGASESNTNNNEQSSDRENAGNKSVSSVSSLAEAFAARKRPTSASTIVSASSSTMGSRIPRPQTSSPTNMLPGTVVHGKNDIFGRGLKPAYHNNEQMTRKTGSSPATSNITPLSRSSVGNSTRTLTNRGEKIVTHPFENPTSASTAHVQPTLTSSIRSPNAYQPTSTLSRSQLGSSATRGPQDSTSRAMVFSPGFPGRQGPPADVGASTRGSSIPNQGHSAKIGRSPFSPIREDGTSLPAVHAKKRTNRTQVLRALQYLCLAGPHRSLELAAATAAIKASPSDTFLVLLSSRETMAYRGLYAFSSSSGVCLKIHGLGPPNLTASVLAARLGLHQVDGVVKREGSDAMRVVAAAMAAGALDPNTDLNEWGELNSKWVIDASFKFDSAARLFSILPAREVTLTTDALTLKSR